MEVIVAAIKKKAFNGRVEDGMMKLIQEVDPTTLWTAYQRFGIFGQAYLFPHVGFSVGYGPHAVRLNCDIIKSVDMLGSILRESTPTREILCQTCVDTLGEYPSDDDAKVKWILRLVDLATPEILQTGIKEALAVSMRKFFKLVTETHFLYFPEERPTLGESLQTLNIPDYCKIFDLLLIDLLLSQKMAKSALK